MTVHHAPVVVGGYKIVSAEFVKGATSIKHLPEERLPQIAFLGRSNVGKSSLMNALMGRKDLKGLVYLVDVRHGGHAIDFETVENIRASGCPVLIVASKRDKANQSELSKGLRSIREKFGLDENPLCVSSLKKFGLEHLWQSILEALELSGQENDKEGI